MKGTCKPKATIFDPQPSYMARTNPALEFRRLLLKCTSAVGLHVMAQPEVVEAVADQENLDRDHVHFDSQTPQHEPYSIAMLSPYLKEPLCHKSKMLVWLLKENSVFQMTK